MKIIIKILIAFSFITANCQSIYVKYDVKIDVSGTSPAPFQHNYIIENSDGISVQKKFLVGSTYGKATTVNNESSTTIRIGNDTTFIFKNFLDNSLLSEEKIFTKMFVVSDELNLFKWKIESDTLTLLTYKCRKATTTFRGRDYIVYFTEEIPVPDGPGKFNGLPGLILKVSLVNSLSIFDVEAVAVRFEKASKLLANPFKTKQIIPFTDFKKEYNKKYAELQLFSKNQNDATIAIKKGGLELLSDD